MKKTFTKVTFLILFSPLILCAESYESNDFASVLKHAEPNSLVICDVDNTLIESAIELGSVQWRTHIRKKAAAAGYSANDVEKVLEQFWSFVQPFLPIKTVDPQTACILQTLQKSNIKVIALTARDPTEACNTEKQLESVNIFLNNSTFEDVCLCSLPSDALYENGIIYSGENSKGDTLKAFLSGISFQPKRIIFIDDRWNQVKDVENTVNGMNIEFFGIRYSGADKRVDAFNPTIADLQWSILPKVISNEEAASFVLSQ